MYNSFKAEGWIEPWFCEEDLLPGQEWATEIPIAVRSSDVVIVCLSKQSITKEGYVQREISLALDIADEKPEGTIFVVPLLLEKCKVPRRMKRWQWLDYFAEGAYNKLMRSLHYRADGLRLKQASMKAAEVPAEKTNFESFGVAPPITQIMTSYVLGDDLYDEAFSIDTPSNEFLGEYGVSVSEAIGVGEPKKVTALEIWLFDKYQTEVAVKVLMSNYAYGDIAIRSQLERKGELCLAALNKQYLIETTALQMLVTVVDIQYVEGALPKDSYFGRITIEMAVWVKALADHR